MADTQVSGGFFWNRWIFIAVILIILFFFFAIITTPFGGAGPVW